MKKRKSKIAIEDVLTIIIFLYPFRKVNTGLDLMDAGYSLGNYRFFDTMNEVWKLATYLSNVLGMLLMKLPFGDTWVGMNCYTSLMIGITAAVSYRFLLGRFEHKYLLFMGEFIALSLCWGPSTALYHYLGYFLMTFAVILIYKALIEEKTKCFIAAGVLLGIAVLVRMPNITYMALIILVWYYAWLKKGKVIQQTACCILGYLIGLVPGLLWIVIRYGVTAYPEMIGSLFGMTDIATDYQPTSMVTAIFADYVQYVPWFILIVIYMGMGMVMFRILKGRFEKAKKILLILGFVVLLRLCYGRGMFDFNYQRYFSMYKWCIVYLLVVNILCIYHMASARSSREEKLWSVILLVIIWVTPLGSNNGSITALSNLFLVAPVSACMLWKYCQRKKAEFAIPATIWFLVVCVSVQSVLFGYVFVFHDVLPEGEKRVEAQITGAKSTKGLYTTVDKADALNELGGYLTQNELTDERVILYGNIPAISYIFDMEPAVYTTWADLASNDLARLQTDLDALSGYIDLKGEAPVVILAATVAEELGATEDPKLIAIRDYMNLHGYVCDFESDEYRVFIIES